MDKGLPAISIVRPRPGEGSVSWSGSIPLDDVGESGEVAFAEQPFAEVGARETASGGVHVTGRLLATLRIRCRRCLVEESNGIEAAIDIRFEPDIKSCDEALGLYAFDGRLERLDLLPALREEVLLALPSYPLCQEDCKGLCAVCGTDLNSEACECKLDTSDPRWETLRKATEGESRVDDDDENQEG